MHGQYYRGYIHNVFVVSPNLLRETKIQPKIKPSKVYLQCFSNETEWHTAYFGIVYLIFKQNRLYLQTFIHIS